MENCCEKISIWFRMYICILDTHLWCFFWLTNVLEKWLDLCTHMGSQISLVHVLTLVMAEVAAAAAPNKCRVKHSLHHHTSFWSYHLTLYPALFWISLGIWDILIELIGRMQNLRNFLFWRYSCRSGRIS